MDELHEIIEEFLRKVEGMGEDKFKELLDKVKPELIVTLGRAVGLLEQVSAEIEGLA